MATKQEIWTAADDIAAEGKNPTLAAVRERVGGGSYTDISAAMQTWRTHHQAVLPTKEAPPPAVTEKLATLGGELWAIALELANSKLQTEREALEAARRENEEIRQEAVNLADQLTTELETLRAEVKRQAEQLKQSQKEAENARVAEQACQARLESATREIAALKTQNDKERETARSAIEAAAELRGRLSVFEEVAAKTPPKPKAKSEKAI